MANKKNPYRETVYVPWKDWEAVRLLGSGSYGSVYEIHRDYYVKEQAAMKVIPVPKDMDMFYDMYGSDFSEESIDNWCRKKIDQLKEEYQLMLEVKGNPNIVSCEDFEVVKREDDPGYDIYIRMELLKPLHKLHPNEGFTQDEVIKLGRDICSAINVCEKHNIIHRDIKPQNILVNKDGVFKLGDFGVARELDHTTAATRVGSPPYMAPEMIKEGRNGRTVDTYALGILMYKYLNNNKLPFMPLDHPADEFELKEADRRRLSGETIPPPVSGSKNLKKIVLKAIEYDPEKRYQSADDMRSELESLLKPNRNDKGDQERTVIEIDNGEDVIPIPPPPVPPKTVPPRPLPPSNARRKPVWTIILAALLIFAVGTIIYLLLNRPDPEPEPSDPVTSESSISEDAGSEDNTEGNGADTVTEDTTSSNAESDSYQEETNTGDPFRPEIYDMYRDDFLLPDSYKRVIRKKEYKEFDLEQIQWAINEIYARHGRKFKNDPFHAYYKKCEWYIPTYSADEFDEKCFNKYEKKNLEKLSARRKTLRKKQKQ